ncbi:hypothetical protein E2C01_054218 [Portunus trituberculatus]|uniref:Uncharacterized protein n=1 Tax=Portunus trituberculatus TaxID=210409 RepID=A0A5B7GJB1_PORTR|nr:hypothetical protein [Portunus trituberculatus]
MKIRHGTEEIKLSSKASMQLRAKENNASNFKCLGSAIFRYQRAERGGAAGDEVDQLAREKF